MAKTNVEASFTAGWSPFELNHNLRGVPTRELAEAVERIAWRIKSLSSVLGVAATNSDFTVEGDDVETVGFIIEDLAMLSYELGAELGNRLREVKKQEEDDEDDDEEEEAEEDPAPALLKEQLD